MGKTFFAEKKFFPNPFQKTEWGIYLLAIIKKQLYIPNTGFVGRGSGKPYFFVKIRFPRKKSFLYILKINQKNRYVGGAYA